MPTPFDWNVVIAGAWNRAILTPAGIRSRLFQKEDSVPLEVEVSIDGLAPYRVKIDGLAVSVQSGRLVVDALAPSYESLGRAMEIGRRAVEALPETPLVAVGINVRYSIPVLPGHLLDATRTALDEQLSDEEFEIVERQLQRSLRFSEGRINLTVTEAEAGAGAIVMNFHRDATERGAAVAWLSQDVADLEALVGRLAQSMDLNLEETDANDD